jgi:hypothetical protein
MTWYMLLLIQPNLFYGSRKKTMKHFTSCISTLLNHINTIRVVLNDFLVIWQEGRNWNWTSVQEAERRKRRRAWGGQRRTVAPPPRWNGSRGLGAATSTMSTLEAGTVEGLPWHGRTAMATVVRWARRGRTGGGPWGRGALPWPVRAPAAELDILHGARPPAWCRSTSSSMGRGPRPRPGSSAGATSSYTAATNPPIPRARPRLRRPAVRWEKSPVWISDLWSYLNSLF